MSIEVKSKSMQDQSGDNWVYLCETTDLNGTDGRRVELPNRPPLAVFKVGDDCYVIDDTCTHGSASLADGYLVGYEVECPFHAGRFDLRTGEPTAHPCIVPLAAYPVEVRGSAIYVRTKAS